MVENTRDKTPIDISGYLNEIKNIALLAMDTGYLDKPILGSLDNHTNRATDALSSKGPEGLKE